MRYEGGKKLNNTGQEFRRKLVQNLRGWLFALTGFSFSVNLLMLTVPLFMLQVYDRVLPSQSKETLLYLLLIAIIALAVLGALEYSRAALLRRIGHWFEGELSTQVLERGIWSRLVGGSYDAQAQSDLSLVRNVLSAPVTLALFDLPFTPIFLLSLFFLHPTLGLVTIGGGLTLVLLALRHAHAVRAQTLSLAQSEASVQDRSRGMLRGARAIDAMGMTRPLIAAWQKDKSQALSHHEQAADRSSRFANGAKAIRLSLQALILGVGAYLVIEGEMSPGAIIAGSILMGRALHPIDQSIIGWRQVIAAWQAFDRLSRFVSVSPLRTSTFSLPEPKGELSLENVSHTYRRSGSPAITNCSLKLEAGKTLVVLGRSGSGKSTLVDLIAGVLRPDQGRVNLDGSSIFDWPREEFARFFGYIPQQIELMAGSVKDNISRFSEVDPADVHAAAMAAGAHEMIVALPVGYDTAIGPEGHFLSAGQRQRIALARALLGKPRFIVLDEPDSNLDGEGQQALHGALRDLKAHGTTAVVVSHRREILGLADSLVILRGGHVELFGERDKVLAELAAKVPRKAGT